MSAKAAKAAKRFFWPSRAFRSQPWETARIDSVPVAFNRRRPAGLMMSELSKSGAIRRNGWETRKPSKNIFTCTLHLLAAIFKR
jgi:hypothetical protein